MEQQSQQSNGRRSKKYSPEIPRPPATVYHERIDEVIVIFMVLTGINNWVIYRFAIQLEIIF